MPKKLSKKWNIVVLSVLSALYLAGIVSMFFSLKLGVVLWCAALLPSLLLYLYRKHLEQLELEQKLTEENGAEEKGGRDE